MTMTTEAGRRQVRSFRMWDGSYEDLKRAAETETAAPTTFIGDVMEALLGYVRCSRCTMPVPVEFGDLSGMNPVEAIADAVRTAHAQKCRTYEETGTGRVKRPAHEPVFIGAVTAPAAAKSVRFVEPTVKP